MARLNFADIPEQKNFDVLPAGNYVVEISNLTYRNASDQSNNPNALILRWEFEVKDEEYENRKVWDNQICIEQSLWKPKALLEALGMNTETLTYDDEDQKFYFTDEDGQEQQLDLDELIGHTLSVKLGVRQARKDTNTNKEYPAQNRVNGFYPYEVSDADLLA